MIEVELIYDKDCPNVGGARANLLRAFAQADSPARWTEWERSAPESPERVRNAGSPTVLVNGRDVAGSDRMDGEASCRLYGWAGGRQSGVPPAELVAEALIRAKAMEQRYASSGRWWLPGMAALPGAAAGLLPSLTCPACWPAYAGLLSALGLGFLISSRYLIPLTAGLLLVAVFAIGLRARKRQSYGPFIFGLVAAGTLLAGKFAWESRILTCASVVALIASSVWNSWPVRRESAACPLCRNSDV